VCVCIQCADDDEVPPAKKPKHAGGGGAKASSDCEQKIAARVKELRGKARGQSDR